MPQCVYAKVKDITMRGKVPLCSSEAATYQVPDYFAGRDDRTLYLCDAHATTVRPKLPVETVFVRLNGAGKEGTTDAGAVRPKRNARNGKNATKG